MTAGPGMRVALVTSSYHPHVGGVEAHVRSVAHELSALGHHVEVWTVDRGEHLGERHLDGLVVRDLPTPLPARTPGALVNFAATSPPAWRRWETAHRALRPDVLHVQCFGPNGVYATALSRRTGTPLVVSSHGETFTDDHAAFDRSALLRRALVTALDRAVATTGCSDEVLCDLRERFGLVGGVVVPNGVATNPAHGSSLGPADVLTGPPQVPPRFVFAVGRLELLKGFDLLLRAYTALPGDAAVDLVIGGVGSQEAPLRGLAAQLGVGDRVHFTGRLDEDAVDAWMRRAAVVVVPSRREAFGIVALEAWRAGAPLVATSLGGPASFVTDGVDGVLVDPTDVEALTSAVAGVLGDPARAASLAAEGLRSVQRFTWQAVAAKYVALYDAVRR